MIFHALKGTDIRVGDGPTSQDDVVFHGPLLVGENVSVGDDAVVFRVIVEDHVEIGERALVVGPDPEAGQSLLTIPEGSVISDEAVIISEADLTDVLGGGDGSRDPERDDIPSCPACISQVSNNVGH